eukprot:scaffold4508_cov228-Pinguiococcus_pyrenoidosus.AAC.3
MNTCSISVILGFGSSAFQCACFAHLPVLLQQILPAYVSLPRYRLCVSPFQGHFDEAVGLDDLDEVVDAGVLVYLAAQQSHCQGKLHVLAVPSRRQTEVLGQDGIHPARSDASIVQNLLQGQELGRVRQAAVADLPCPSAAQGEHLGPESLPSLVVRLQKCPLLLPACHESLVRFDCSSLLLGCKLRRQLLDGLDNVPCDAVAVLLQGGLPHSAEVCLYFPVALRSDSFRACVFRTVEKILRRGLSQVVGSIPLFYGGPPKDGLKVYASLPVAFVDEDHLILYGAEGVVVQLLDLAVQIHGRVVQLEAGAVKKKALRRGQRHRQRLLRKQTAVHGLQWVVASDDAHHCAHHHANLIVDEALPTDPHRDGGNLLPAHGRVEDVSFALTLVDC